MSTERIIRAARLLKRSRDLGAHGTAQRVVRRLHSRLGVAELDFPLLPGDVAESSTIVCSPAPARSDGSGLVVGFLCAPPGPGSGGHTTMFRMVSALERSGHRCVIVLYDRYGGDPVRQGEVIRRTWPWISAEVRSVRDGFGGLDACVATAWPTAHVLATHSPPDLRRLYLIQDFEPFFYPHGAEFELALDSYRFGFANISLGQLPYEELKKAGIASTLIPFSCDTSVYSLTNDGPRNGVVWYVKPDVPRRGHRLAILALAQFHRRHPEQTIHVYGDDPGDLAMPVVNHGRLSPPELNELYNRTVAGLAMSFTNLTLVAEEMLAAGCIPVINDPPDARADLPSKYAAWAAPTPSALAQRLCEVVEAPSFAVEAAASVRQDDWAATGAAFVEAVESNVRGA
jgi:glycosyltransferase involved in cell wall biosynthesis